MNEWPNVGDKFKVRKRYSFKSNLKNAITTLIDLELYESNICVMSFYQKNQGNDSTKYEKRHKFGPGIVKSIFKACIEAYYQLDGHNALIFVASNDGGVLKEDNARFSAYLLFLNNYISDINSYIIRGSVKFNTFMMYHNEFEYKDEAILFFESFENEVAAKYDNVGF